MTGRVHDLDLQVAQRQAVAVADQPIKITAVGCNIVGFEQCSEYRLHLYDVAADNNGRTSNFAQVMCCRQMVGMGMGFEQIDDLQPLLLRRIELCIGGRRRDSAIARGEVEHRVNDRGLFGRGVVDNVADRIGGGIEKRLD